MRVGSNPNKEKKIATHYEHQVIIPVHIPNREGYFKDSLKILSLCLTSVIKTSHSKTFITIINNGSCREVFSLLQKQFDNGSIHELIHTSNIGKNNAILKAINGHYFKYITVADADVLFLNNWQFETMKVFHSFPKTGVVGLTPQVKLYADLSYNALFDNFFFKKMSFSQTKNPKALKEFTRSIGWDNNFNQDYLKMQLTIRDNSGFKAVVGSGHYVATYRRDNIATFNNYPIDVLLSSKFDRMLLDEPGMRKGSWRLTTEDNYAFHMGNVYEPWMDEKVNKLTTETINILEYQYPKISTSYVSYFLKNHLFRKLLDYKPFINWFVKFKGLPKEMTKTPWHV